MKANGCFKLFGKKINFYIGDSEKRGRLVQVRIDSMERMLVGIDESGFIEEYELKEVKEVKSYDSQKELARQIIKQVNKQINSFKHDLGEYRKEEIAGILQKFTDNNLQNSVIECFSTDNQLDLCEHIYEAIGQQPLTSEESDLLCGIVAYKQHDADRAYRVFGQRWMADKQNVDKCRDFILVADEFDNDVLCFFLLNYFFQYNGRYINDKYYANLWWKYLFYMVKYNYFKLIENMEITEWNVRILIDSYIYIFHMYNMQHLSEELTVQFINGNNTMLQQNNEDFGNVSETMDELNLYRNYLPDTVEGYYLRFEVCMNRILESYEKSKIDVMEGDMGGYVYEYVKSRNYGFIIGYDFQKYFYHWEYLSHNLRRRIMDNIYSNKKIEDEDKIYVCFRVETHNKRSQAMDII